MVRICTTPQLTLFVFCFVLLWLVTGCFILQVYFTGTGDIICLPQCQWSSFVGMNADDIKWEHFPRYKPFVRGIHRSPVDSPYKGQWRGALMFSLICAWTNVWANNRDAGDLGRHCAHYDVIVMDNMLRYSTIFFRGCVPEMLVTSYSVTYCIYIPGKPGFCFHYYCAVYGECK